MVKIITIAVFLFLIVFLPQNVLAQENVDITSSDESVRSLPLQNSGIQRAEIAQNTATRMQERTQEFRTRIQQIGDATKRSVVQNITDRISESNSTLTGNMSGALDKFSIILERVKMRAETLSLNGQNITGLLTNINSAETAIENAREMVEEQSQKEYSANITNDAMLRSSIGAMVAEFRRDIMSTYQEVIAARRAVASTITAVTQLESASNNATESAILE